MKGDVVVVPFPFSDLTQAKRRPALVVAVLEGDDLLLCQITSQRVTDSYAIPHIVLYKADHLRNEKVREVIRKIVQIVQH